MNITSREQQLFEKYRATGFPNYRREDYCASAELRKIINAPDDEAYIYATKTFTKYQSANGFLFSYFPHWIDVECGSSASIRECWDDDEKLMGLICKTLAFCEKHGENWSTNRIRQNAKVYCASQSVSNFNPMCAKLLYNAYANNGVTFDMSMGWGGRLLGFWASNARHYIGTDPSTKTFNGLLELNAALSCASYRRKKVQMFNCGSENINITQFAGQVDFCFTSPPYFDTEKYAYEPTQSWVAYDTPAKWFENFIKPTFQKCYAALKQGGVMAINIADTRHAPDTIRRIIEIATACGFTHEDTLRLELSSIAGKGSKYEPIFIFRKGEGKTKIIEQPTLF